jgi:hypothetical protein
LIPPQPNPLQRKSYGAEPNPAAIEVFERNLRSFIALATANDIKILLSTQPLQTSEEYFLRHMEYKPYNSVIQYPLHEEFIEHHRAFNKAIQKVALENDALFIDNNAILAGKDEYFIDFVHYTPKGIERLAENYAEFLIQNDIIQ